MNERLVVLCVPLCLAAGAAGAWLVGPNDGVAAEDSLAPGGGPPSDEVAALREEVRALGHRLDHFDAALADLADAPRRTATAPAAVAATPTDDASREAEVPVEDDDAVPESELAGLFDGTLDGGAQWDLFDRLRASGQLEDVLARLEAHAEANSNDPEAHFSVGMAYIMKLQEVGASFQAGPLANKADEAFDRTLALDEDHLDARMSKAVSLSFWPAIMGKRPAAIEQFEILIDKQKQYPPKAEFAEAYTLLGNLHLEGGKSDAALAVFQQGLEAYPDDATLAAAVAELSGDGN